MTKGLYLYQEGSTVIPEWFETYEQIMMYVKKLYHVYTTSIQCLEMYPTFYFDFSFKMHYCTLKKDTLEIMHNSVTVYKHSKYTKG